MGYFRHKLDRARSRAALDDARQSQARALAAAPAFVRASRSDARPHSSYLRYAVRGIHEDSQHHRGIFVAAGELHRSGELWQDEYDRLRRALNWFNANLIVPKGVAPRAIFWFKPAAHECHLRMYEIARLLRLYGYTVWSFEARRPGRVVYEDDLQVAALPFAARAWERREPTWPWEATVSVDRAVGDS
jgi:hypothetical protein